MSGGLHKRGKAPERACLKRALWPNEDQRLWAHALQPQDLLSDSGGTRADHRPISNQGIERGYGRWLTRLARQGRLGDRSPAARITPEEVKGYIVELEQLGNRNSTICQRLSELRQMAKIMGPDNDWTFIKRFQSKIRVKADPPSRKRGRLAGADELYTLGLQLIGRARGPHSPRRAAVLYRDGLIIALLALRPLRLRNITDLTLGRDVVSVAGTWMIVLVPALTKTHVALEFDWPQSLVEALHEYLRIHRPLLLGRTGRWTSPAGDRLWLSVDGSALTQAALHDRVVFWTRKILGRSVNPHLFRDSAATSMAIHDPVHVRLAASLLGHRTFKTTERHYNQAKTLQAHRQFTAKLCDLRRAPDIYELKEIDGTPFSCPVRARK